MTITNEINRSSSNVFRRAYIKRRSNTTGLYETNWVEITEFVKKWGKIQQSVDELKINEFKHSGINLVVINDEGKFNPETNVVSLWFGFMTRFRTLLKIEVGYLEDDGTELPTNSIQGIFILTNDVKINGHTNDAVLQFKSLQSVFNEVKAKEVTGIGATLTASEIITKFRDHTDGSGNFIFQQFISSGAWNIAATTNNYNLATSTSIGDKTCWDVMRKLSESEGYILLINKSGGFEFRNRDVRSAVSQFSFFGQGFKDPNVIRLKEFKEPITKFFNRIRFKWKSEDTETSYVTSGTITAVDPSLSTWKYGVRTLEIENTFLLSQTVAQGISDNLLTEFNEISEEIKVLTKMCPQLEISDKISFSYRSYDLTSDETIWNTFDWASATANLPADAEWADESGENFDWNGVPFKIISKILDLDKFTNMFILRKL